MFFANWYYDGPDEVASPFLFYFGSRRLPSIQTALQEKDTVCACFSGKENVDVRGWIYRYIIYITSLDFIGNVNKLPQV